jgi:hypothetical protein
MATASRDPATSRLRRARVGFAIGTLVLLLIAVYVVATRWNRPRSKPTAEVTIATRQGQITGLRERLAKKPCETVSGELLVKQLIAVSRVREAATFGVDFISRCGESSFIRGRLEALGYTVPRAP